MSELVKEAVALESLLGVAIKPHLLKKSKSKNIHKIFFLKQIALNDFTRSLFKLLGQFYQ